MQIRPALAEGVVVEQALAPQLRDESREVGQREVEAVGHEERLADLREAAGAVEQIEHGGQLRVQSEWLGQTERIAHHEEIFALPAVLEAIDFA